MSSNALCGPNRSISPDGGGEEENFEGVKKASRGLFLAWPYFYCTPELIVFLYKGLLALTYSPVFLSRDIATLLARSFLDALLTCFSNITF
jgi:hypothetical protein